jgi:hypothetical protein
MNYRLINKFCYGLAISSVVVGTVIGIAAVWVEAFQDSDIPSKGLVTTCILFTAAALGAVVTKLMTVEE